MSKTNEDVRMVIEKLRQERHNHLDKAKQIASAIDALEGRWNHESDDKTYADKMARVHSPQKRRKYRERRSPSPRINRNNPTTMLEGIKHALKGHAFGLTAEEIWNLMSSNGYTSTSSSPVATISAYICTAMRRDHMRGRRQQFIKSKNQKKPKATLYLLRDMHG